MRNALRRTRNALFAIAVALTEAVLASRAGHGMTIADAAAQIPNAKLIWEAGGYLYTTTLGNFDPQQMTPGFRAKWSPDGTKICYSVDDRLYVTNADFTGTYQLASGINTGWWGTGYSWTKDGNHITAIMGDKRTIRKIEVPSGNSTVIYTDASQNLAEAAEIDVTGRFLIMFRLDPNHVRVWDLHTNSVVSNSSGMGWNCTPAWAPDGSYFTNTLSAPNRPIMRTDFDPSGPSMAEPYYYIGTDGISGSSYVCHFSRVSNDGNWVVFCATPFGGYDVFLWKIGTPNTDLVRITTTGGSSPDIFIPTGSPPPPPPPAPTIDGFSAGPSAIAEGDTSTLSWTTTDATSVSIDNGIGGVSVDGSRTVSPSATTTYTLTATGAGGTATDTVTVTVTALPPSPPSAPSGLTASVVQGMAINVGGSQRPVAGWENDDAYATSSSLYDFNTDPSNMAALTDPAPAAVYGSVRHNGPSFDFGSVPDGAYTVRIHFYDDYSPSDGRAFTVTVEGQDMLTDYSIIQAAGGLGRAAIETFSVSVSDGNGMQLDLDKASGNDAFCSGIEIIGAGAYMATLSWTDESGNEDGFRIERSDGGAFAAVAEVGANVTSFTDTGLAPSTTYTYRVVAYNAGGTSSASNEASVTTSGGPAPSPTAITSPSASGQQLVEGEFAVFDGTGDNLVWTWDMDGDAQGPQQFATGANATMVVPGAPALPATITITLTGDGGTDSQTHTVVAATEPFVTVLSPNGGEFLTPGQTCTIAWDSQLVENVTIYFSPTGGEPWDVVEMSIMDTDARFGACPWTVPDVVSSNCVIAVADYSGNPVDTSDAPFTISADSDGDGIADAWELQYVADVADCGPDDDPDGDGYTNLDEFLGGTDPLDAASMPDILPDAAAVAFSCTPGAGASIAPALFLLFALWAVWKR